jgi:DnaJ-domain-containing protein 1
MSPELEKYIDLALVDGVLTDKERQVLKRKAQELGVDQDEFEMVLESKLHLAQKATAPPPPQPMPEPKKPKSNKEGDIKKCPSCGAPAKSFNLICEECGHEFRNVEANSSMNELLNKLNKISKSQFKDEYGYLGEKEYFKVRADVIRDFSIPTSKEDLIEFATKSIAEFGSNEIVDEESNSAWESKSVEAISKLQIFALTDKSITPIYEVLEKKLNEKVAENKKNSRNDGLLIVIGTPLLLFVAYLMYAFIFSWFGINYWPF